MLPFLWLLKNDSNFAISQCGLEVAPAIFKKQSKWNYWASQGSEDFPSNKTLCQRISTGLHSFLLASLELMNVFPNNLHRGLQIPPIPHSKICLLFLNGDVFF